MSNEFTGYRLDFTSGAWRQIGLLDKEAFGRLTSELRALALEAARVGKTTTATMEITVGDLTAVYEIDDTTSTLLVLDVRIDRRPKSRPSSSPRLTPGAKID